MERKDRKKESNKERKAEANTGKRGKIKEKGKEMGGKERQENR